MSRAALAITATISDKSGRILVRIWFAGVVAIGEFRNRTLSNAFRTGH